MTLNTLTLRDRCNNVAPILVVFGFGIVAGALALYLLLKVFAIENAFNNAMADLNTRVFPALEKKIDERPAPTSPKK